MLNQIKPEDRPKAFVLVIAILGVFGFSSGNILRMLNPGGGSPSPSPTPAAPTAGAAGDTAAAPGPATAPPGAAPSARENPAPLETAAANQDEILLPNLRNNPFREIPKIVPTPEPVVATPAPRLPAPRVADAGPGRTIAVPLPFAGPGVTANRAALAPVTPVAPPPPPLVLMGVISGEGAVAMIKQGEREHIVHVGQYVAGYKVVGIGTDDVQLRRGKTMKLLSVGTPGVVAIRDATPEPQASLDELVPPPAKPVARRRTRTAASRPAPVIRHVVVYPGESKTPEPATDPVVSLTPAGESPAVDVPLAPQPSVSATAPSTQAPTSLPARDTEVLGAMPPKPDGVLPPKPDGAPAR